MSGQGAQTRFMNRLNPTFVVVSLVSVAAAIIAGVELVTTAGFHEPTAKYVVDFHKAKVVDEGAFITALGDNKVVFRHDLALGDGNGNCEQPPELKNIGLTGWVLPYKCNGPNVGLHVTQRVGYDSLQNLKDALATIDPASQ
jgi:hypothetical protein